ncbi:hypothetical protein APHAL10511_001690 [Amanita phalloides]|nr:hypothetical protein APHAL10511_001690 [Amanita phalloides]
MQRRCNRQLKSLQSSASKSEILHTKPDPRVQGALLALCTDNRETGKRPASQAGGVTRQRGFCDIIRDYGALYSDIPDSQERVLYDQNSDYVKTPVVTPNGSLEWEDGEMDSMRKRTREVKGKGEAGGGRYCLRKRRERKAALPELSHSVIRQILQPDPVFLSITSNEIELSIFAESHALHEFEPIARRDRHKSRSRSRSGSMSSQSRDFEPIEISCEKWRVLQIDSHSDQLDSSGARVNELSAPLAAAGISILYQSSYMSDFIFVKESRLQEALDLFANAGFDLYPNTADFTGQRKPQGMCDITGSLDIASGAILTRYSHKFDANALGITLTPDDEHATSESTSSGRASPHSSPSSPISSDVVMLSPDLACVGLSDEFGVDHWGLKIVKLVAFPDLIFPTKSKSVDPSVYSTPHSPILEKQDVCHPPDVMTPAMSPASPLYEEEDDGYFSHSPKILPMYHLPKMTSRSHSDLAKISLDTPSKHKKLSLAPSPFAYTSGTNSPTSESHVPFFSFTRTAEGSSLTTDVRLLATLFPRHERHMVICGAELDMADDVGNDEFFDEHGSTLKCLQVDLRQFGLDKYGLVNRFSRALANNGINHMYSSTFKTANLLVEKRHANRTQHLLSAF